VLFYFILKKMKHNKARNLVCRVSFYINKKAINLYGYKRGEKRIMERPYETVTLKNGNILKIFCDELAENPRTGYDNLGTLVFWMRGRYSGLGDNHEYVGPDDFLKEHRPKDTIIYKVYAYIHGGIALQMVPFPEGENPYECPFDSGFCGFCFVSKADARNEYGRLTSKILVLIEQILKTELDTYNQYLEGDVYGYQMFDQTGIEEESCWGFYGSDWTENGLFESAGIKSDDIAA
jgi:hypothetical protein